MRYEINQRYNSRCDRCADNDVVYHHYGADACSNSEHACKGDRNPHGGRLAVLRADVPAVKTPAESVGVLVEVSVVAPRIVFVKLENADSSGYVSAVGLEGNAGAHDKVDAVNVADEVVDVVVAEGSRDDIAALFPRSKLAGVGVRRAGELEHHAGSLAGLEHEKLVLSVELLAYRVLTAERRINEKLGDLGNDDVLEEIGGERFAVLLFERRGDRGVPVDLILLDAGVLGNALLAIRPSLSDPDERSRNRH